MGFEPTSRDNREPLFESGALSLSATSPLQGIFEFYLKSHTKTSYHVFTRRIPHGKANSPKPNRTSFSVLQRINKVLPKHRSHLMNFRHKYLQFHILLKDVPSAFRYSHPLLICNKAYSVIHEIRNPRPQHYSIPTLTHNTNDSVNAIICQYKLTYNTYPFRIS